MRARRGGLQGLALSSRSVPPGVQPLLITLAALHRLLDKVDSSRPVVDAWEVPRQVLGLDLLLPGAYRRDDAHIDVGERLDKTLWVARGRSEEHTSELQSRQYL